MGFLLMGKDIFCETKLKPLSLVQCLSFFMSKCDGRHTLSVRRGFKAYSQ